jgi:c-di-GMP-binding flagellar brake protein YcgR
MSRQEERRGAPRVAERVLLSVRDAKTELQAETKNLSAAGVYCALESFIPPMTKLQLRFELPVGGRRVRIRCTGVVVRVEPVVTTASNARYHTGIWFSDLSARDREAILGFVRQRLAEHPSTGY